MSAKSPIPYIDLPEYKTASYIEVGQFFSDVVPPLKEVTPHRHDYQAIIWTISGQGRHIIDNQEIVTPTHSLCLIARGQVHQFVEMSADFVGFRVLFADDFLANNVLNTMWNYKTTLFNNVSNNDPLGVAPEGAVEFESIFSQILKEYENQEHFDRENILRYLLLYLLTKIEGVRRELFSDQPDKVTLSDYEIYQAFISRLEELFQSEHNVNFYADQVELSARQLSDISKKIVGKTAKQIIVDRVILEAKRYLQFTSLSVQEISYALGYESPFYFSQAFKNATKLSPSAFKKQL